MSAAKPAKVHNKEARGAIRDQGYQRYTGSYTSESGRWALIAGRMLKMTARQPWVMVMLILCIFPPLAWGVGMYIRLKMYAMGVAPAPDDFVWGLLVKAHGNLIIAFLMALFAGGGAVPDDVRGGAFQFYFARPVTREQYLVGKTLPPILLVLLVTGAPALLLAILRIAVAKDGADALHSALIAPAAIGLALAEALVLGLPVVALSSLSRGRGYVQGAFAALFILPWIVGNLLTDLLQSGWGNVLSVTAHLQNLGRFLFQLDPEPGERVMPIWATAVVLSVLVAGSIVLLRRRLAAVEVIGGS
jgi:ABC-2 type transport system permease protein